jgi:2-polyprenyl-3-methyl-5-hydroxy-6-metoxy-1,4-benzoquinol methylase
MSPTDRQQEHSRLNEIALDSWYAQGANAAMTAYGARVFRRTWRGRRALELGPAEGQMTGWLLEDFEEVTLVEGAEHFAAALREQFPSATVVHSLFEDFTTTEEFDTILVGNVLEHVRDPQQLLNDARRWLSRHGRIYASVPNARSVHRQAAVLMGLLASEHSFNEADIHHGHRRVYNPESLRGDFLAAGLRIEMFGGYWLKPLSNAQIEATWTGEMLDAFMQLGERYPDIAGQIYVVGSGQDTE